MLKRDSYSLEDYKGELAIVYRTTTHSEPAKKITYYLLTDARTETAKVHFGWTLPLPVCYSQINQAYYAQLSDRQEREIPTNGTVITVEEHYPCPKSRKGSETRYWCGYWQRYDKKNRTWLNLES